MHEWGIEIGLKSQEAVKTMKPPTTKKELQKLIGKLVEIYIDDVVVKSISAGGHLEDLRQVLERTRKFGLKMNQRNVLLAY